MRGAETSPRLLSYATCPSLDAGHRRQSLPRRGDRLSTRARKVGTNWYANDARARWSRRRDGMGAVRRSRVSRRPRSGTRCGRRDGRARERRRRQRHGGEPLRPELPGRRRRCGALDARRLPSNAATRDQTEWDAYAKAPSSSSCGSRRRTRRCSTRFTPSTGRQRPHPGKFPEAGRIAGASSRTSGRLAPALAAARQKSQAPSTTGESNAGVRIPATGHLQAPTPRTATGDVTVVRGPPSPSHDGSKDVYVVGVDRSRFRRAVLGYDLSRSASLQLRRPTSLPFADDSPTGHRGAVGRARGC